MFSLHIDPKINIFYEHNMITNDFK